MNLKFAIGGALLLLCGPVFAGPDADMQHRYCAGMEIEVMLPDHTRADCLSETHAIEVEFTEYWHQSLGQALHYALWSEELGKPRRAGIILICRKPQDTCTDHFVRLYRIIEHFALPVTIWTCAPHTDMTLAECQMMQP